MRKLQGADDYYSWKGGMKAFFALKGMAKLIKAPGTTVKDKEWKEDAVPMVSCLLKDAINLMIENSLHEVIIDDQFAVEEC